MSILSCNFKPFLSNKLHGVLTMKKISLPPVLLVITPVTADMYCNVNTRIINIGGMR